jgi:hypothetical protein
MTRELERIRFVTRHFNDLQGLRYGVPLGLVLLGWGSPGLLRAGLLLGAFLLILGAKRYYRRTFGEVEQRQADPAAELCPASVYSPAGCLSRIQGFRQVTPFEQCLLATMALAMALFVTCQAIQPSLRVVGDESLGQHPRVVLDPVAYFGKPALTFYPHGRETRPPSMARAMAGQTVLVFSGAFLLGLWLWRERRWSQVHHLFLGSLLLGLSALGASLGFIARGDGAIAPLIDLVLPALVYPGQTLLLCGSSLVLAGLFDHLQVVRALGLPEAAGEEGNS